MKSSWVETIVGAIVLCIAMAFFFFVLNRNEGFSSDSYDLTGLFFTVDGVEVGGDVRMGGVKIGSVKDIALVDETYQVALTVAIDQAYKIPADSEIAIATSGLLGGSFVKVQAGADSQMMNDGDQFIYAQDSVSIIDLFASFAAGDSSE